MRRAKRRRRTKFEREVRRLTSDADRLYHQFFLAPSEDLSSYERGLVERAKHGAVDMVDALTSLSSSLGMSARRRR